MKKIVASALSCAMIILMSTTAFAEYEDVWDSSYSGRPGEYFKVGNKAYSYEDIFSIDEDTTTFIPGKTYYFPCKWGNNDLTADFFDLYNVGVSITTAFPDYDSDERKNDSSYLSSTEASKRVKTAKFTEINGKFYFEFTAKDSFSYVEDKTLRVVVIAKDKVDSTYRDWEEMDLDIGYFKNGGSSDNIEYITTSYYQVDTDTPIVEFDGDLSNCKLEFEDGSTYEARFSGSRDKKMNLLHTTESDKAISDLNPKANLKFLSFTAKPSFLDSGRFLLKTDGKKYVYEIKDNHQLVEIGVNRDSEFHSIITNNLTSYVASNIPLVGAVPGSTPSADVTVTPETPTIEKPTTPISEVPFNPGTGAKI